MGTHTLRAHVCALLGPYVVGKVSVVDPGDPCVQAVRGACLIFF